MLSYQHIYHAGNVVDCQKHLVLSALLQRLCEKPAPFCYIDTHSGRGCYDLRSNETQKIAEYRDGIAKIWNDSHWPDAALPYRHLLQDLNPAGGFAHYPGSPLIAASQMRSQDRAILYELHPQEHTALAEHMQPFKNVAIKFADGWKAMNDLPPRENRGLVFIDPSYELKDEYLAIPDHLTAALRRWRNGMYVVWYPLLAAGRHHVLLERLAESGIRKILRNEILIKDAKGPGLYGTGLLVINPPWQFDETLASISGWLTALIGRHHRTDWLVPE